MRYRKDLSLYEPAGDGKGAYIYRGAYFAPQLSGKELTAWKVRIIVLSAVRLMYLYSMGRANTAGFLQLYVTLPFLALLFFAGFGFLAAVNLFAWKEKMTLRQYSISCKRLKISKNMSLLLTALLLAAELLFSIISGGFLTEMWPLALILFNGAATGLSLRLIRDNACGPVESVGPAVPIGQGEQTE